MIYALTRNYFRLSSNLALEPKDFLKYFFVPKSLQVKIILPLEYVQGKNASN